MRGSIIAAPGLRSKSSTLSITWITPLIIVGPPEPPATSAGCPFSSAMTGDMLDSGRLSGATSLFLSPTSLNALGTPGATAKSSIRSEEHTSELQSHHDLVCRLLLEKKNE